MSSTRVDQSQCSSSSSSSIRRSSLIVNLSTTKKRSSVTTLTSSRSSFGPSISTISQQSSLDSKGDFGAGNGATSRVQPQSAPPSLAEPSYSVRRDEARPTSQGNTTNQPQPTSSTMQVIEVSNQPARRQQASSKEVSPEPIVEVKHTSSSSSLSSSSSSNQDHSTKLVRRRTVRRYHRATELNEEEQAADQRRSTTELTISVTGNQQQEQQEAASLKSHFRTRQIGAYLSPAGKEHQKSSTSTSASLSTSTSTSKIAKCSITTSNRKSTTSKHSVSSQQSSRAAEKRLVEQEQQVEEVSSSMERRTPLELRLDQSNLFASAKGGYLDKSIAVQEEEESSVHHRQSFSSSTTSMTQEGASLRKAAVSSSSASEAALRSRHSALTNGSALSALSADLSASSSRRSKASASSVLLTEEDTFRANPDAIFSSPDVQSLARTIDTDFAELENFALSSAAGSGVAQSINFARGGITTLSTRLFRRHPLSPVLSQRVIKEEPEAAADRYSRGSDQLSAPSSGDHQIQELLSRAQNLARRSDSKSASDSQSLPEVQRPNRLSLVERVAEIEQKDLGTPNEKQQLHQSRCKAVMSESIERIDQRMSDLCKKLNECQDTKEAIDLLKVMIQMIEKAWSVPVCGDDLGFKLCNSLREAGGLDIIVGFIHDSEDQLKQEGEKGQTYISSPQVIELSHTEAAAAKLAPKKTGAAPAMNPPLRLNLSSLSQSAAEGAEVPSVKEDPKRPAPSSNSSAGAQTNMKDSDSDIMTSDLGLDSTSVESLPFVGPTKGATCYRRVGPAAKDCSKESGDETATLEETIDASEELEDPRIEAPVDEDVATDEEETNLMKEELVFLSARLLSQCLTSLNRNYIVDNGLDPVIKLACNFTTMKSTQSQRLLSRSLIMRQSSSNSIVLGQGALTKTANTSSPDNPNAPATAATTTSTIKTVPAGEPSVAADCSDTMHAIIGTEILQHLFKHSEDTCSRMISIGGLQAILYGCRSSNIETLRHCASALANLALYGGSDSQQTMIEHKAHVWLFPLAFHEDDNIQYYACLAIVVLVANQEIEADVLKSSTLDLVEPFVTSHEPRKFAESTTSHIHGQSASWLRKLIPLLESKRVEARNLACFHFAMEAHIKKEQGQTDVFKEIGAVEPLRRVGSSPQAIAAKFACQALRLIGEKEPHKLSQQVPLWTNEDVLEWVGQSGFEKFRSAFKDSGVDGDLLLQLDDEMLRLDLGIENGIIRRRFLRELANLKRIADYSSVDKTNLCQLLSSMNEQRADFSQYIYPLVQLGVSRENVHLLDIEQLLRDCRVTNSIHRMKLSRALKELQDRSAMAAASSEFSSTDGLDQKTLDVFVSYRRSNGSQLASLLKVHLQLRGFSVFIDVERLEAGKFDNNLLDSIKTARNFILVLSPNALDRCIGDHECKDWVHKEIVAALSSNCNIIPIMDNFLWPEAEQLPEDMRSIGYFNGVRWYHDYQDACVDKVERFIRGELYNGASQFSATCSAQSSLQRPPNACYSSATPSIAATPSAGAFPTAGSTRAPFDADHHPLSVFSSHQYLQQHSQAQPPPPQQQSAPSPVGSVRR